MCVQDDEKTVEQEKTPLEKEISELFKSANSFLKENQLDKAKENYLKILDLSENNNYALVSLGDLERKRKNYTQSIEYYNICIEDNPQNNYALFGLADCYKAQNKLRKAIEIWEKYLLLDEKNISVLTRIGDAYRKINNLEKSKEIYLRALDLESDNAYALIGLGHLFYDFNEYKNALYYWTRMLDLHQQPDNIRILTSIGNCHKKLKSYDNGIHFFNEALKIDSKNFYALFGLADCHRGKHEYQKSLEYWNMILEFDPENKVILTRAGDAYRNIGNYPKAIDSYTRAIDIAYDEYAVFGLALIAKDENRYDDAIQNFSSLVRLNFKNYKLYLELAESYLKTNQKTLAIETLEKAQKLGFKSVDINNLLKRIK